MDLDNSLSRLYTANRSSHSLERGGFSGEGHKQIYRRLYTYVHRARWHVREQSQLPFKAGKFAVRRLQREHLDATTDVAINYAFDFNSSFYVQSPTNLQH